MKYLLFTSLTAILLLTSCHRYEEDGIEAIFRNPEKELIGDWDKKSISINNVSSSSSSLIPLELKGDVTLEMEEDFDIFWLTQENNEDRTRTGTWSLSSTEEELTMSLFDNYLNRSIDVEWEITKLSDDELFVKYIDNAGNKIEITFVKI